MQYKELDFSPIKTNSAHDRINLVRIDTLLTPGQHHTAPVSDPDFDKLIDRIIAARKHGGIFRLYCHNSNGGIFFF